MAREALCDKKAADVTIIDVRGISSVTDFLLVATANNGPHLKALYTALDHAVSEAGAARVRRSGGPESGWIVCDCVDVIAHLLTGERRDYYALEQLWRDAPRVA
jgi:ribosome-associated protein